MRYVLPLADREATLSYVGGKGASLARLAAAGLPVPEGFHVTTDAYREFVAANQLQGDLLAEMVAVDVGRPATLEKASQAIARMFMAARMPPAIASDIVSAYAELPGNNPAVAVRSSATAEDLPEASFAGQQESYLNVSSPDALLEATKKCWSSLWTARAIGYRARQGIPPDQVALAVVVQLLVPAEAAGILFTVNPVSGRRDEVVVSAAWGLGEAVVGGKVTPDNITVDKQRGAVRSRDTADKQLMTVRVNGGTAEQPVPESLRKVPVLNDEAVAELTELAVQIEQLYAMPMDIEWALADGEFAILQARPITALPEPAAEPPSEWPMPDPDGHYMRGSIVDFMPDPLSPLFATLGLPTFNVGLQHVMDRLIGHPDAVPDGMFFTINGYAYMQASLGARQWWLLLTRLLPALPRIFRTEVAYWQEEELPRYAATAAKWEEKTLTELPATELVAGVREVMGAAADHMATLQTSTLGAGGGAEALFTKIYDRFVKKPGDPSAPTFLLGFDSAPIQAEKALYDLAMWCHQDRELAAYLTGASPASILEQMAGDAPVEDISAETWEAWLGRFAAYLDAYGYAIYDLDFAEPLPMDDPTPTLATLKMYLCGEGQNPHERQQAQAERRRAAEAAILDRLKRVRRWAFRKTLGWAQTIVPLREDSIAEIGRGYPVLRQMLLELGRRYASAGMIASADDIFWLKADEVADAAAALERGGALPERLGAVKRRKAQWQARKQVTPPPQLPAKAKYFGINVEQMLPGGAGEAEDNELRGVGASPGQATAVARVLHGPEDFDQMQPGDVLVAAITTPAWTPLFAMASAIVTDVGGPLSHGSIVAREYGIPAVLGTGLATRRIRSGQRVTVNGSEGLVIINNGGR